MKYIIRPNELFTEEEVLKVVMSKLNKAGVVAKHKEGAFVLSATKQAFTSTVENKILLKEGDVRINKLKRGYLNTKRLTEKQYNAVVDALFNTPAKLGCVVEHDELIKPRSFSVPKDFNIEF